MKDILQIKDSAAVYAPMLKGCGFEIVLSSQKSIVLCAATQSQKKDFCQALLNRKAPSPTPSRASHAAPTLLRGKSDGSLARRSTPGGRDAQESEFFDWCKVRSSSNALSLSLSSCQQGMEARIGEVAALQDVKERSGRVVELKAEANGRGKALLDPLQSSATSKAKMEIVLSKLIQVRKRRPRNFCC